MDTSFNAGGTSFKIPSTDFSYSVSVLAIQNINGVEKILVGGGFAYFNNNLTPGFLRLNSDGTLDNTFNNGLIGTTRSVGSIAIQTDGKILIAGSFDTYGGVPRNKLARLNPDGTLDNSFPNFAFLGDISIKLQPDGKIILTGDFDAFNGDTNRKRIVRLLPNGTVEPTSSFNYVNLNNNTDVTAISLQSNGKIIIAGLFTTINGNPANRIGRLNEDGSFDNTFVGTIASVPNGNVGFSVAAITTLSDNKLLIGGVTGNGTLFRLSQNGEPDTSFTSLGFNSASVVNTIVPYCFGQKIIIGGNFSFYGTRLAAGMMGINSDGSVNQ
jgi:uncharacterized delta-60 repeat protein